MIYLDANENPFSNGMNRYPDPQQKELKLIISDKNNVPKESILLGNGSDGNVTFNLQSVLRTQ